MEKFYKINNEVMAIEQGQEFLVQADWVEMSAVEVEAFKNPPKTEEQIKAHFKALYLGVVESKLKTLDYDSLATVKLWEGDPTFGAEATRILDWYKSIIALNYSILSAVLAGIRAIPTDEGYLTEISSLVF